MVAPATPLPSVGNLQFKQAFIAAFSRSTVAVDTYVQSLPLQIPPLVHVTDCPGTPFSFPPASTATGTLARVLSTGVVKIGTVAVQDSDPLNEWDPSVNPPTGHLANLMTTIFQQFGVMYNQQITIQWVYTYTSIPCFDLLYAGMIDMVAPHFDSAILYQSAAYPSLGQQARRTVFDTGCLFGGQDIAVWFRNTTNWHSIQDVKNAVTASPGTYKIGSDGAGGAGSGEAFFGQTVTDYIQPINGVELNVTQVYKLLRDAQGLDILWDYFTPGPGDAVGLTMVLAGEISAWGSWFRYDDATFVTQTNTNWQSIVGITVAVEVVVAVIAVITCRYYYMTYGKTMMLEKKDAV